MNKLKGQKCHVCFAVGRNSYGLVEGDPELGPYSVSCSSCLGCSFPEWRWNDAFLLKKLFAVNSLHCCSLPVQSDSPAPLLGRSFQSAQVFCFCWNTIQLLPSCSFGTPVNAAPMRQQENQTCGCSPFGSDAVWALAWCSFRCNGASLTSRCQEPGHTCLKQSTQKILGHCYTGMCPKRGKEKLFSLSDIFWEAGGAAKVN